MKEKGKPTRITREQYESWSPSMLEMTYDVLTRMYKTFVEWHGELTEKRDGLDTAIHRGERRGWEQRRTAVRTDSNLKTIQRRRLLIAEELDRRNNQ